jgi:hypothetical protein
MDENGQPQQGEIQVPALVCPPGVNLNVQKLPNGDRHLIIGPVVLVFPMTAQGARQLGSGLFSAGIQVAAPGDLPK